MLKISNKNQNKITASGTLLDIKGNILVFDDPKEGEFRLSLELLQQFIGKDIKIDITNTEESLTL